MIDAMRGTAERPAELTDVQGAWRRDGRRIGNGPMEEVSEVLWLQVGRHFCDLRTPLGDNVTTNTLDVVQAFAGTVEVAGGDVTFSHDLDSLERDPAHPDVSTLHRVARAMYERGPGFEEHWVLASLPGDEVGVAERRETGGRSLARIVRVGGIALAVWGGPIPGGSRYAARDGWEPGGASCGSDDALGIDDAVVALAAGLELPAGWLALGPSEV